MRRFARTSLAMMLTGGLLLAGCDVLTSTQARLDRATAALEDGKLSAALSDAREVTGKHPEDPRGWMLISRIGLKYGDAEGALRDLERAAKAGADAAAVRPVHDQALLQTGKFDELAAQEATSAAQKVIKATALAALNRRGEAGQLVQSVLAEDPDLVSARLLDIRLQLAGGARTAAVDALDKLLADEPNLAEGWLLKARLDLEAGDTEAAIEAFGKADMNAPRQLSVPEHANLLAALTEARLTAGQTDEASRALSRLKGLAPQSPITEYLSARISLAQGDATTAVATLQRSLARNPAQPQARLLLGAALMEQGTIEQAREQLDALIADQPENMDARKLLARLYMSQGDSAAAQRILVELPEGVPADPTADWMRSAILSLAGQRAESLAVLEQAAKADPGNVPLQLDLVRAYLTSGRREDADRVLQGVPSQKAGWAGKQLQVLTRLQGKTAEQVRDVLKQIAAENPKDAQLRTVVGQFQLQLGDPRAAGDLFRSALAESPDLMEAHLGLAGVALRQSDLPAAAAELKQVLAGNPKSEPAYLGLAAIAVRQSKPGEAREWLEQAITAIPATVNARLTLAELAYREKKAEEADALLEQAVTVARDKPSAWQQAGDIQLRAGQSAKAEALFVQAHGQRPSGALAVRLYLARREQKKASPDAVLREWLQRDANDVNVRGALAEYLLQQNSLREAITQYERLIKQTSSPVWMNNLAWAYQTTGDARAEDMARRAYEAVPANPAIADTYGWVLLEEGRAAEALPLLEKAAKALPDNADVQAHLKRARELAEK